MKISSNNASAALSNNTSTSKSADSSDQTTQRATSENELGNIKLQDFQRNGQPDTTKDFEQALNSSSFISGNSMSGVNPPKTYDVVIDSSDNENVQGSSSAESVLITGNDNNYYANDGGDTIVSDGNDNVIYGMADGNSITMNGERGYAFGGEDGNTLVANGIDNSLYGEGGGDTLQATESAVNATLDGGDGDDLIYSTGDHTLRGGADNDKFFATNVDGASFEGGSGFDILHLDISHRGVTFEQAEGFTGTEFNVTGPNGEFFTVTDVEQINFGDGAIMSLNDDGKWIITG